MSDTLELHRTAMELADRAMMARFTGSADQAAALFREAFVKERDAAQNVIDLSIEPTRSVLLRSAASLAIECGELREAERLIAVALAGEPPDEIAAELRELFERVNFHRHLALRGVTLAPNEFQLSISGNAVAPGIAPTDEYLNRVQQAERIVYRTAERKLLKPFAERISKAIREQFSLFISVPRTASFAVSLRLGQPTEQMLLPEVKLPATDVIDELLTCMELFDRNETELLAERIQDEAYYQNFVGLARQMAPDGDEIKTVGFTSSFGGQERSVQLTKTKAEDRFKALRMQAAVSEGEANIKIIGRLKRADSTQARHGSIYVIDDEGDRHKIIVPISMMADIVKPLYEERVVVEGIETRKGIVLEDIGKAE